MFDFFLAASVLFFKYMRAVYVCSKAMTQVSCSPAVRETVLGPLGPALPLQSWGSHQRREMEKEGEFTFFQVLPGQLSGGGMI